MPSQTTLLNEISNRCGRFSIRHVKSAVDVSLSTTRKNLISTKHSLYEDIPIHVSAIPYLHKHPEILSKVWKKVSTNATNIPLPKKAFVHDREGKRHNVTDLLIKSVTRFLERQKELKREFPYQPEPDWYYGNGVVQAVSKVESQRKMIDKLVKLHTPAETPEVPIVVRSTYKPREELVKLIALSQTMIPHHPEPIIPDFYEHLETFNRPDPPLDLTICGDVEPNPGPRTNRGRGRVKKTRNNRGRQGNPRRRQNTNNTNTNNVVHINDIMPFKKFATLTYLDASPFRNAPGASFLVYSMRINDLYDPDPLILTGSISNFKEMMSFYSYYRVLDSSIRWSISNLEAFPLACGIVFSQTNLVGTLPNLAACQNAFENDFATPIRILSAKGGMDKTDFNLKPLSISKLLGVGAQYRADVAYAGAGLATPSIPLWANFIVYAPTGASLTQGYTNNTTLRMRSEFFGRLNNNA